MSLKQLLRISHISAALLFAAVFISAQPVRPDFNRPQVYDVQHYTMRLSFDRPVKKVMGETTVSFKPLKDGLAAADFDAVGIQFESVTLEGGPALKFASGPEKITVTLDRPYNASETVAVRFKYSAAPKKGIYFIPEKREGSEVMRAPLIWTQGEPEEARHWLPSFDHPGDKATTEQIITVPKGETVIGNGQLLGRKENGGTVTWHYKMPVRHSTYLISFVIGEYTHATTMYRDIPMGVYVYPGTEGIIGPAFGKTGAMMKAFEDATGVQYPFNKYDQTIVGGFTFGGMENITATTLADTEVFFAATDFGRPFVEDLVSHELAHSWFGNMVTCRNWAELWLNEGFATFMEAVARERLNGRDDYIRKVRSDAEEFIIDDAVNKKRHGLFNVLAKPDDSLFDTTTYKKGGAVIHTLREEIGDAAFWKGVNIYLTRHKFDSVETPDLQKTMEEASGKDLKWFFDQWVYRGGHPKLDVRHTYNAAAKTLQLTVSQTQRADSLTPSAFRFPLEVEFTLPKTPASPAERKTETVQVTKRTETFTIPLAAKPTAVKIDPNEKVPLKTVKMLP